MEKSIMDDLTIIRRDGCAYLDSREVAGVIGKHHNHLLRDIRNMINVIDGSGASKTGQSNFFIESRYRTVQNKIMPCYLISKKGAEMIASKLTGMKGVLFACEYVTRFNELETAERRDHEERLSMKHKPRLGEVNAYARIIVRGMKNLGALPEQIMEFLEVTYEPYGITTALNAGKTTSLRWLTASELARLCGMYSLQGKPHTQAAACVLIEKIHISKEHKRTKIENYGCNIRIRTLYDHDAYCALKQWMADNDHPAEIHGLSRTYHVQYLPK